MVARLCNPMKSEGLRAPRANTKCMSMPYLEIPAVGSADLEGRQEAWRAEAERSPKGKEGMQGKKKGRQGIWKQKEHKGWRRPKRSGAKCSAEHRGARCRKANLAECRSQPHFPAQILIRGLSPFYSSTYTWRWKPKPTRGRGWCKVTAGIETLCLSAKWERRVCPHPACALRWQPHTWSRLQGTYKNLPTQLLLFSSALALPISLAWCN